MTPPRSSNAWQSRDVLRVTVLIIAVLLTLVLLWVGREIFFLAFIGILFGLTLSAAVDLLQRFKVPRGVAAPAVLLLVILLLVGLTSFAAPQVTSQLQDLKEQVPKVAGKVRSWIDSRVGGVTHLLTDSASTAPADSTSPSTTDTATRATATRDSTRRDSSKADSTGSDTTAVPSTGKAPNGLQQLRPQAGSVGKAFFTVFSSTLAAIGGTILVIFMTLFIAIEPKLYQRGFMHLVPHRNRARIEEVLQKIGIILRRWLVTQMIAMVVIGVVTGLAMWALGVRGAIALGVIAGILEFIPFVGPIASAVPAIAMGLLDSPEKAVWVAVVFTLIQQAEGHLLIPLLMKDSLDLPPVLTILNQALMATVFGFLGLLVAVPMLAAVIVAVRMLYVEDVIGDKMGASTG